MPRGSCLFLFWWWLRRYKNGIVCKPGGGRIGGAGNGSHVQSIFAARRSCASFWPYTYNHGRSKFPVSVFIVFYWYTLPLEWCIANQKRTEGICRSLPRWIIDCFYIHTVVLNQMSVRVEAGVSPDKSWDGVRCTYSMFWHVWCGISTWLWETSIPPRPLSYPHRRSQLLRAVSRLLDNK